MRVLVVVMLLVAGSAGVALAQSAPAAGQGAFAAPTPVQSPAAATASAQAPAQAPAPAAQGPGAGWQNGFFIQTPNGDNRLQFGFVAQLDGRFALDDPLPITNTFTLRKARPILSGRIARFFDYRLMAEFGGGTATVLDAYVDTRFSTKFRVRAGKDKSPVGYEVLIGDAALLFPERSLVSALLPNRDVGIQVQGDLAGGKLFYAGGVMNGVVDGTNSTADVDTNSSKDLAGRVVVQPFRRVVAAGATAPAPGPLSGFGFQIGGSTGRQNGALPSFRTTAGSQTWFSYASAAGTTPAALANGDRHRVTPAVFYYYKAFGTFAEYAASTQAVSRGATSRDVTNTGWQIAASYLLTGEAAGTSVPAPRQSFDPPAGMWGALQIIARYAELTVDGDVFDAGFAASGASRKAKATTVGFNWYPAQPVKYYFTYERTVFDGPTVRPIENTILFRVQAAF